MTSPGRSQFQSPDHGFKLGSPGPTFRSDNVRRSAQLPSFAFPGHHLRRSVPTQDLRGYSTYSESRVTSADTMELLHRDQVKESDQKASSGSPTKARHGAARSVTDASTISFLHRDQVNPSFSGQDQAQGQGSLPRTTTMPNLHPLMGQASFDALPDYSSTPRGSDIVPIKNFDKERVEQWRYTATTIDRNLTRSPDTPRRFNEEETKGLMGKSTNDGNESKSVVQANASVPRAQESSSSGSSLLHPGFSRTRQNMDAQRFTSDLQFSPSKVSPNKGKKAGDPKKLSSTDTPERTQETASQALRKIMIARALNESIVDTLTVEISLTVICLQKPPPLNLNKVTRRPRSRSEVHSRDHSIVVNHPIRLAAAKDDPQTYTTHGLVLVLGKLYEPSAIPSPVAAALPSPMDVATLYDATTPLGSAFHARQTLQGSSSRTNATKDFQPKDVNYITFYIDTLLAKVKEQDRMIYLLEEDNEDKEVDKAQLQTHISHFYHEAKMGEKKYDSLQMLACFLLESIPTNKSLEAVAVAGHLGINLVTLMADAQDVSNPAANRVAATKTAAQKALKKVKRLEHDVEYWRARAEASEKFNAIVQEIEAARENA